SLTRIADEVGTPVYVYSRSEIERAYRAFDAALEGIPHEVCYAVKANSTLGVLGVLVQLGAGATSSGMCWTCLYTASTFAAEPLPQPGSPRRVGATREAPEPSRA